MHKVQGARFAICKLMYGLSVCTDDNHSLKLVAYRLVHTEEPYIYLHKQSRKSKISFRYIQINVACRIQVNFNAFSFYRSLVVVLMWSLLAVLVSEFL